MRPDPSYDDSRAEEALAILDEEQRERMTEEMAERRQEERRKIHYAPHLIADIDRRTSGRRAVDRLQATPAECDRLAQSLKDEWWEETT